MNFNLFPYSFTEQCTVIVLVYLFVVQMKKECSWECVKLVDRKMFASFLN
jgi:hypothetical protein